MNRRSRLIPGVLVLLALSACSAKPAESPLIAAHGFVDALLADDLGEATKLVHPEFLDSAAVDRIHDFATDAKFSAFRDPSLRSNIVTYVVEGSVNGKTTIGHATLTLEPYEGHWRVATWQYLLETTED